MKKKPLEIPTIKDLYQVTSKDFKATSDMLGDAFREDPIWKDIMKNQEKRFPHTFGVPTKYGLKYGKIYAPTSDIEAAAVWIGPPYIDMTIWRIFRSGAFSVAMKLGLKIAFLVSKVFDQLVKDRQRLMKGEYLYLNALGVSPEKQGTGLGSKLVKAMIENLDPQYPIYLETESERNVRFYEKLGFKVLNTIEVPTLNLPMWEMVYKQ
jgi:GNAT superfamily N-acetyltransferase